MKSLAAYIMRGPVQATLVAWSTGLLSLMIPFVGLLSSATLGLVTLRNGVVAGLRVGALAGLGCLIMSVTVLGSPWPALVIVLVLWLPVWVLAAVLRHTRSLALTIQLAGLAGVVAILMVHALASDLTGYWLRLLGPFQAVLMESGGVDGPTLQKVFAELAPWMTGAFALGLMLQTLLGLVMGRWWQGQLYNPGGFGAEFRAFRLHPVSGLVGLLLVAMVGFVTGPGLVPDLLLVLTPLWLFQGLAVIHGLLAVRGAHPGWVVAVYVLLILFMPQTLVLVACLGLVDTWADLRARLGRRPSA